MAMTTAIADLETLSTADAAPMDRASAARRLAWYAGTFARIEMPLAPWFDWERLRVNVAHHVAPELVRWR